MVQYVNKLQNLKKKFMDFLNLGTELNPLSLRSDFAPTRMTLLMQMAQAIVLQDTMTTLLVCTYKQSFELILDAQRESYKYKIKSEKKKSEYCIFDL